MGPSEVWVGELEQAMRALKNAVQSNELADEGRRKSEGRGTHRP
jgi:ribosomal protein S21